MINKLQKGERVAVYHGVLFDGKIGEISDSCQSGEFIISFPDTDEKVLVWPQQCRRIKPKYKLREFWIKEENIDKDLGIHTFSKTHSPVNGWLYVKEVRIKK